MSHMLIGDHTNDIVGVGRHFAKYRRGAGGRNAAAPFTTLAVGAAADEVSARTATQFPAHIQMHGVVSAA
jgi:hypothetical protein